MQIKKADLTNGPINRTIFSFAVPLIVSNIIQVLFNMADQIVLGQMAGSMAVASVGACSNSIHVVISTLQGLSVGVTILLSRAIGAEEHERSKRIISTAVIAALFIGTAGAVAGIAASTPLLHLTNCPENVFDGAKLYITIYLASAPVMILYNFTAAILRVTGDSKRPSIYLLFAGALNVVMNILLCAVMTQKVAAVAIATLVSQALGAFLTVRRLCTLDDEYRLDLRHMAFDPTLFVKILRYGVPSAVNSAVYPLANMLIQANVNAFDPVNGTATAGYAAGASINGILGAITGSFSQTTSAMAGQNIGAEKPDRVRRTIRFTMLWDVVIVTAVGGVLLLLGRQLLSLYLPDSEEALAYALTYQRCLTTFYFLVAIQQIFGQALNAYGYSLFTGLSSLLATVLFRPIYVYTVFAAKPTFAVLVAIFPVSWAILSLVSGSMFAFVHSRYLHGRLRKL